MFRRAVLIFTGFSMVCSYCAGQTGSDPAPSSQRPAPIIVNPGNAATDLPTAKLPDAQSPSQSSIVPELKSADLEGRPSLNEGTKLQLIQIIDHETAHVRRYMVLGDKSIVIGTDGSVKPGDADLFRMAQSYGVSAKIGDRAQITNIVFHEKSIYFEINGGPKKKSKWYQHIQISGAGASTGQGDPSSIPATGSAFTLEFKKHVPEMTGAELKKLLSPVLDFSVKSAAQVFAETLPPKIRDAVKNHEVLVGMNHDMVVMAKDRPPQKVREKDSKGKEYEDWIYGTPPQDVVFVRFVGDEVVQVKIAKVGGEMIVKTQKEVDVKDGVPTLASLKASASPQDVSTAPEPEQPKHKPTLKRPDEQPDPAVQQSSGAQMPPPPQDEPQWGTKDKAPADSQQKPQK
ncbi:MAG TPA: hypothetical protein VFB79_19525 [Candidatus Angelobacter sp.]|nr:hypothetical protein [Candidatus Angelobacter sp.]